MKLHEHRLAQIENDKAMVAANTETYRGYTIYPATGSTGGAKNIGAVMSGMGQPDRYFRNRTEAIARADQLAFTPSRKAKQP